MKVLVFMKVSDLRPAGGPAGYCYNIYQELTKQGITEIDFLPADNVKSVERKNLYYKITKRLPKWLNALQIAVRRKKEYQRTIQSPALHNMDFSGYDAIHFHSTGSLYKHRRDIEGFKGKVILTTHSPIPQHQEIYAELPTKFEKKIYKSFYSKLDQIDEYAFRRADYVVFPCEEAEESYFNNWDKYAELHSEMKAKGKLFYIPTGIQPKPVLRDRDQVCRDHNLNPEKHLVSYAGRHNQVKGYDLLQLIAIRSWERKNDYSFVICGKESPLQGLKDPRWTEVGWTNDSQSVIAASDVFVLPNRETYFDIIMLEVLSSGKLIVASRTGGNKYFEKIGAQGIFLYDSIEQAIASLERIAGMDAAEKARLENENKALFYAQFTTDKYLQKYLQFLHMVTEDER